MRLKIVSDGTTCSTSVVDTGAFLEGVLSISWSVDTTLDDLIDGVGFVDKQAIATIVLEGVPIEAIGTTEVGE